MKKQSFLILEFLIAFFLIIICSAPLLYSPYKKNLRTIETLKKIELERICELTWKDILLNLKENDIPDEKVYKKDAKMQALPEITIELPTIGKYTFDRNYSLYSRREKKQARGIYRLIYVEIAFKEKRKSSKPIKFTQALCVNVEKEQLPS